jgi:hypothetical protein
MPGPPRPRARPAKIKDIRENESFHDICFIEGHAFPRALATPRNRSRLWHPGCWFPLLNVMDSQSSISDYRVEVSGWDVGESFFVEKATLELSLDGARSIHLRHPLRAGSMVFLRLIDSRVGFPALPVAYQVLEVSAAENEDLTRVTLRRLGHRRAEDEESKDTLPPSEMADTF